MAYVMVLSNTMAVDSTKLTAKYAAKALEHIEAIEIR